MTHAFTNLYDNFYMHK